MTYNVLKGTLNPAHSLTHCNKSCEYASNSRPLYDFVRTTRGRRQQTSELCTYLLTY